MHLATSEPANTLLADDPLALLIGMVLDQQVRMEKAFDGPAVIWSRLGGVVDAERLATTDLTAAFCDRPAVHRFPAAMATRVQSLAKIIVSEYGGDPTAIWSDAKSGAELLRRIAALPGFGEQKSQIFVALLGKQFGVRPRGWREAAGKYGGAGVFYSVADAVDDASITKVREYKQAQKAAARASRES